MSLHKNSYTTLSGHGKKDVIVGDVANYDTEGDSELSSAEFDSITQKINEQYAENYSAKPIDGKLFDDNMKLPKGKKIGIALHKIFEVCDYTIIGKGSSMTEEEDKVFTSIVSSILTDNAIAATKYVDICKEMAVNIVSAKFVSIKTNEEFYLSEIDLDHRDAESNFDYMIENELKNNFFDGSIDLVFEYNGRYYIIDWKSDALNDKGFKSYNDYDNLSYQVDNRYAIQRVLYSYSLVKLLSERIEKSDGTKNTREEAFNELFGGIYYVFLRGVEKGSRSGIYAHSWDSYNDLKKSYDEILKIKKVK